MALEPLNLQKVVIERNTSNSSVVPVERNSFSCLVKVNSSVSKAKPADYNVILNDTLTILIIMLQFADL